ncbi:MAG: GNAT family N-acetyltransferase [Promethearchaeota archaeon]
MGYKVLGIFDGYPEGITEYILTKRLPRQDNQNQIDTILKKTGYTICEDASEESKKVLHAGLHEYVIEQIGDLEKQNPPIQINLVIKNDREKVIGGILTSTVLKALYILKIWMHEDYRRQGYGTELILAAERIAKQKGCISALAMVYSFQTPEFFEKANYEIFGSSEGYPPPTKEYYFKKQF